MSNDILRDAIKMAEESLAEHIADMERQEKLDFLINPDDDGTLHEIADGAVPVYHAELIEAAAQNNGLATHEPEIGPAFDGSPTPVNIIAANFYEAIEAALWEEVERLKDEIEDNEDNGEVEEESEDNRPLCPDLIPVSACSLSQEDCQEQHRRS